MWLLASASGAKCLWEIRGAGHGALNEAKIILLKACCHEEKILLNLNRVIIRSTFSKCRCNTVLLEYKDQYTWLYLYMREILVNPPRRNFNAFSFFIPTPNPMLQWGQPLPFMHESSSAVTISYQKGTDPIFRAPSSWPHLLVSPNAHLQIPSHWELGFPHVNFAKTQFPFISCIAPKFYNQNPGLPSKLPNFLQFLNLVPSAQLLIFPPVSFAS